MNDVKQIRDRWRTRRLMAWIAFWTLVLMVPASFAMPQQAQQIAGIIQLVASSLAGVVMVYIGAAAYDDVNHPGSRQ